VEKYAPITVHIVVKRQLLIPLDVPIGENTHPNVVSNRPFGNIAIRATTMVGETAYAASFGGVNELYRV
jgi:hypothetical protein